MTGPLSHTVQDQANKGLEQFLANGPALDVALLGTPEIEAALNQWRLVLLFYAAVQHVNARLDAHGHLSPSSHAERKRKMRQVWPGEMPVIAKYEYLEVLSREARYNGWVPDAQDLAKATSILATIEHHLV